MEPLISPVLWAKTGRMEIQGLPLRAVQGIAHKENVERQSWVKQRLEHIRTPPSPVFPAVLIFYGAFFMLHTSGGALCCSWFSSPCSPFRGSSSGTTRWTGGSRSGSSGACCWHTAGCSPRSSLSCSNSSRSTSRMERSVAFMENLGKLLSLRLG